MDRIDSRSVRMLIEMLACPIGNIRILKKRMWLVLGIIALDAIISRLVAFFVHYSLRFAFHTTLHHTIMCGTIVFYIYICCDRFTYFRANLSTRPWTKLKDKQSGMERKCPFTRQQAQVKCPSCQD
eukprot:Gb_05323 [translate_table: standard]